MLLSFSVGNFLSFRDVKTLNMLAAPAVKELEDNVFAAKKDKLLKSAVIYGANASGKSNLFNALKLMKDMMLNSSKEGQYGEDLPVIPFLLNKDNPDRPSRFELQFLLDGCKCRYGFEATGKRVVSEWLALRRKTKEQPLFLRVEDQIQVFPAFELAPPGSLERLTRGNALFLSVCAQFNVQMAQRVLAWVKAVNVMSGLSDSYKGYSVGKFLSGEFRSQILEFLRAADVDIVDLRVSERGLRADELPRELSAKILEKSPTAIDIESVHNVYDEKGEVIDVFEWDFERFESQGTKKVFALSGLIIETLRNGGVLLVDELDSRLHPTMTRWLVGMFNSTESNPKSAQLVFATHDTNLLDKGSFRRDQIWFAEKDQREATDLYSLFDFKGVRNDAAFERNYLDGRYGAIPFLNAAQCLGGE